jgi:hypothetical protein
VSQNRTGESEYGRPIPEIKSEAESPARGQNGQREPRKTEAASREKGHRKEKVGGHPAPKENAMGKGNNSHRKEVKKPKKEKPKSMPGGKKS